MTENVSLTGVASAASIDGKANATPTAAARRRLLNRRCEPSWCNDHDRALPGIAQGLCRF